MKPTIRFIFIVAIFLFPIVVFGQGENNVWIWGKQSRLDFTAIGPLYTKLRNPIAAPDNMGRACIAGKEGSLLLFSNKNRLYNNEFTLLNGSFNLDEFYTNPDELFIIRKPGTTDTYFQIQTTTHENIQWNITEISFDSNDGLGKVVTGQRLIPFEHQSSPNGLMIKGTCKTFWLLTIPIFWDRFRVFQIDETGINGNYTETFIPESLRGLHPHLFATNHQSSKIAYVINSSATTYTLVVCDFDKATGIISNFITQDFQNDALPKVLTFSENGKQLYISYESPNQSGFSNVGIMQFYIAPVMTSIPPPHYLNIPYEREIDSTNMIFKFHKMNPYHLRMGPDGAIYTTLHHFTMMNVGRADALNFYESASFYKIPNPNASISELSFLRVEMPAITDLEPWFNGRFPLANEVFPLSPTINSLTHHIFSCDTLPLSIQSSELEAEHYLWNTGATTPSINGTPGKKYWVTAINCEAIFTDTFLIVYYADTMTGIASQFNEVICSGSQIALISKLQTPTSQFQWYDSSMRLLGTGHHITTSVYHDCKIYLHETTTWGCEFLDSISIQVKPCCKVMIPNSFTPNNDGQNDMFRMVAEADKKMEQFHIYNRYGELVFKTYNMNEGWDGTFKGKAMPMGTYYYMIQYRCYGNEFALSTLKGEVHLLR